MTLDLALTEAAIDESAVANLIERDVIIARGADAATFLQGQLSQNVEGLAVGESALSFLLHPQGKVAAWGRISRVADVEFWFDVDAGYGDAAATRLTRFLLRVKCTIDSEAWPMVEVRGPKAVWPGLPALEAKLGAVVVGYDLLGPEVSVPAGIEVGDPQAFEAYRIKLAWPKMGAEIVEATIPAELGVVNTSADFIKGCYVGQELVARIDSRGSNTPRKIHKLSGVGNAPEGGAVLTMAGDNIGVVTSAAATSESTWYGLGSVRRAAMTPGEAEVDGSVVQIEAAAEVAGT